MLIREKTDTWRAIENSKSDDQLEELLLLTEQIQEELDQKDSIADQSAISLIICATGICWNQVVCKRMAGSQRISLKQKYRYFIGTICIYFRANIYYHISMKGEYV